MISRWRAMRTASRTSIPKAASAAIAAAAPCARPHRLNSIDTVSTAFCTGLPIISLPACSGRLERIEHPVSVAPFQYTPT
jgi:hypothetical protein